MSDNSQISNEVQKELKELSSTLAAIPKADPYKVPEGYFKEAEAQATEMAREMGILHTSSPRRMIYIRYAAIAASFAILAMMWMNFTPENPEQLADNDVSIEELIEYLDEEGSFEIIEDDLINELADIETVLATEELEDKNLDEMDDQEITREEIIEYLLEDNIDLATIIDEF